MLNKLFGKFRTAVVDKKPSSDDDSIVLGALSPSGIKSENRKTDRRAHPWLVSLVFGGVTGERRIFMCDKNGYFNIVNPTERMTHSEAESWGVMSIIEADAVEEALATVENPHLLFGEKRKGARRPVAPDFTSLRV